MSTDVKVLREFLAKMDWEGGLEGMVRYGVDAVGDDKLASLLEEFESVLNRCDTRIRELYKEYPALNEYDCEEDEDY